MSGFPYLVDAPEDGAIEATAWLPADAATTGDEAIEEFVRRYTGEGAHDWWRDEGLVFDCTRREFYRGLIEVKAERETGRCVCDHPRIVHRRDGTCTFASSTSGPCVCTTYRDAVTLGTRTIVARAEHYSDDPEAIRFEKCEPDDDGAEEYWRLELVEP